MNQHIFSLYRSYLRQVRSLPHVYLRHFFIVKGGDDFRSVLKTKSIELRRRKLRRISKDLQRLCAANQGISTAFDRVLDIAYGRVGKLRQELLEPLLSDPSATQLPSTGSARNEKNCLPIYSPELAALLTSSISRTTKPLQKHHLISPPGLPERAKANSEDAVLLGPLSGRREYNIRWRFFKSESKKVLPPLQASPPHTTSYLDMHIRNRLLSFGFQDIAILQELFVLSGSPSGSPDHPYEQKSQLIRQASDKNPFDGNLSIRWLRRRYQALLGRIPLLTPRHWPTSNSPTAYDVQLADSAMTTSGPRPSRLRVVDAEDLPWISDVYITVQSNKGRR